MGNPQGRKQASIWVALFLFGGLASAHVGSGEESFPDVKDFADVTITLHRGDPMGGGPTYRLIISGDGTVRYMGYSGVFITGARTGHVSNGAIHLLIEEFRSARFFEMHGYASAGTDLPVCITEFQAGTIRKKVVDYGFSSSDSGSPEGFRSGAPKKLVHLERRIDEIAASQKWVHGSLWRRLLHWR